MEQRRDARSEPDGSRNPVPLEQIREEERAGPSGGRTSAAGRVDPAIGRDVGNSGPIQRASYADPVSEASDPVSGDAERVAGAAPLASEGDSAPGWMAHPVDQGGGGEPRGHETVEDVDRGRGGRSQQPGDVPRERR